MARVRRSRCYLVGFVAKAPGSGGVFSPLESPSAVQSCLEEQPPLHPSRCLDGRSLEIGQARQGRRRVIKSCNQRDCQLLRPAAADPPAPDSLPNQGGMISEPGWETQAAGFAYPSGCRNLGKRCRGGQADRSLVPGTTAEPSTRLVQYPPAPVMEDSKAHMMPIMCPRSSRIRLGEESKTCAKSAPIVASFVIPGRWCAFAATGWAGRAIGGSKGKCTVAAPRAPDRDHELRLNR